MNGRMDYFGEIFARIRRLDRNERLEDRKEQTRNELNEHSRITFFERLAETEWNSLPYNGYYTDDYKN